MTGELPRAAISLPCHRDREPVLGFDEMIVTVVADVDLHPVNLTAWHNSFEPSKAAKKIGRSGRQGRHLGEVALRPSGSAHEFTLGRLTHREQLS